MVVLVRKGRGFFTPTLVTTAVTMAMAVSMIAAMAAAVVAFHGVGRRNLIAKNRITVILACAKTCVTDS